MCRMSSRVRRVSLASLVILVATAIAAPAMAFGRSTAGRACRADIAHAHLIVST